MQLERDLLSWVEARGTPEVLDEALRRFIARGGAAEDAVERLDAIGERVDAELSTRIDGAIERLSRV